MQKDEYTADAVLRSGWLPLDDLHSMCVEESGNPRGSPVVSLLGEPGAGMKPSARRIRDTQAYRPQMPDQCGCGRSNTAGELHDHTEQHLLADQGNDWFERQSDRILDPDPAASGPAVVLKARSEWLSCSASPNAEDLAVIDAEPMPDRCIPFQRVGIDYRRQQFFLAHDPLHDGIPAIRHIPGLIVNGQLEVVCLPVTAIDLEEAWPQTRLKLVQQAGQLSTESDIAAALLKVRESLE
jgi:hypothetical protein